MSDTLQQRLDLPPIDQVGFVVPDLDAALKLYEPLFGPFEMLDAPLQGATFRGEKKDCHLSLAFGKSGVLEMEFIAVLSGACPHQEFLDAGGNGMHHVRYRVGDHDAKVAAASAIGFDPIWSMRMDGDIAFSYLQRAGDPLIIEFLQMP
ncbi:MAG: VOC family protein [Pseudomonadales bacterium]